MRPAHPRRRVNQTVGLLALLSIGGFGGTCEFDSDGDADGRVRATLDATTVSLRITEAFAGSASVRGTIVNGSGQAVSLTGDQSVRVNDSPLSGPDATGAYQAQISASDAYAITIHEPTRGVQSTTVAAPADFVVLSPPAGTPASLSGFTLEWSNADAGLSTTVLLAQTIFGQSHTASFGPSADAGSLALSSSDLAEFQQGADISVVITRTRTQSGIAGTASGSVTVERSRSAAITPGP